MTLKPYTTQLKRGAGWSVAIHEHHAAGPNSGYPTLQAASYEADQGRVGEIAKSALEGYTTRGGSDPERTPERMGVNRSVNPTTVISHRWEGTHGGDYPHASVRVFTPEGHELSSAHVQGLMAGTHNAQELREHYQDEHEARRQRAYEEPIQHYLYTHDSTLPHSGAAAAHIGVPSSDSPEGAHILGQISRGVYPSAVDYPHYSEGAGSENPRVGAQRNKTAKYEAKIAAGAPRDRAGDPGRIVDHR